MAISDLTYKVIAYNEYPDFNTDESVDWALEMISLGNETEHLLILGGLTKPTNYFETIKYLEFAFNELSLVPKTGDAGIISYTAYYVMQIAKSNNVRNNLSKIFNNKINNDNALLDLYKLNWAWDDLDWGNTYTDYWPEATIKNIEAISIDMAKKWLIENKHLY